MATQKDFGIAEVKEKHPTRASDSDVDSYLEYPDDGIETQFTWRSAVIGSLLGCVVASSNMYLGLKIGWSFSAGIFGAILGFAILKAVAKLPLVLGGGPFGMKENCSVQTAATASGGLAAGFVAGVPAMFRLGLMPPLQECWQRFYLWTLAAAFYGMCFAVPLRSYFVIKQKLVFPSCVAAAHTIRTLHADGSEDSKKQTKWIIWSFSLAILYKFSSYFIPFIVDMHPLYWLSQAFDSSVLATIDLTWGWKVQITTAFIGAGMMVGMNTALSFFGGSVLAWGILGPAMMYGDNPDILHDTPRGFSMDGVRVMYWNLWIGIVIMVCASFTELAMQYKSLWHALAGGLVQLYNLIAGVIPGITPIPYEGANNKDPVRKEELIPAWMWLGGLLASTVLTIFVLVEYFDMSIGASILAGILGFVFSFIGCQSSGETDINPTGVIGKASQVVFTTIPAPDLRTHQLNNLIAGVLSSSCASQAVDMVGDLKTGHLLRASPRSQFFAQTVGTCFGIVVAVCLFMLFATAYPCILMEPTEGSKCEFTAPAVSAWAGVTRALTTDISKNIPPSCRIACLVFGLATIVTTVLKNTVLKKYTKYIPNWNAIGVAFVSFDPSIPLANLAGATIAAVWSQANPKLWEVVGIALASGLIAGEGIGGVLHAVLNIFGISREAFATGFACPGNDPEGC
ncbi:hypothetical protein DSO57_1017733 [Entomophthora muscae]|uniref:Uncharacterized protein n=1 Tax=Entomophthora muscae TaxID=34485 RepID=A0ACC2UDS4_9FUNG|nr:hypothetical protein DSO57_1017733 [Entomophthora muscae]